MTLDQLLEEVYALGFEEPGELNEAFIFATNRALRMIFLELAPEKKAEILLNPHDVSHYMESFVYIPGNFVEISLPGVAFSFKFSGDGEYKLVFSDGKVQNKSFSGNSKELRSFTLGAEKIIFTGNSVYNISDFSVFSSIRGNSINDIPIISDTYHIDVRNDITNLMLLTRPPCDKYGNTIEGSSLEGYTLILPKTHTDKVILYYKELPERLTVDDGKRKIDIPAYLEHILPLLTAVYIWLDDDPEKADYYMNIYRNESNKIKYNFALSHKNTYSDVTGWA